MRPAARTQQRTLTRGYRPRVSGTTAARGYGASHQEARAAFTAAFRPGQPCAIGGEPLRRHTARRWCDLLDLAHNPARDGYLGLACRRCNRGHHDTRRQRATATTATVTAPAAAVPLRTSRQW